MKKRHIEKNEYMQSFYAIMLVIGWLICFPFILLYDRVFGGWKK